MATLKAVTVLEQNANTLSGVNYDTTVYATAAAGGVTLRVGRDIPNEGVYVIAGVQTAVNHQVVLDNVNAFHGARMTVKRPPLAVSTSVVTVLCGSAAGGTAGVLGTSTADQITAVFDGVAQVWR